MHEAIQHLSATHATFAKIIELYGSPNIPWRPEGFETLCKIILEQQVSLDSAKATFDKLKALVVDFTPENILECSDEELRNCGLSRQKSAYLRNVAEAVVSKTLDLDSFASKTPDEVRAELIKIKGIGHWTIDVYLMFSLHSPDIMPLADIGIILTMKELWHLETREEMFALAETWKPYRTAAAFFLWHYYLKKRGRVIHM
jgi:DNA-3-methyladenine glycosylase II